MKDLSIETEQAPGNLLPGGMQIAAERATKVADLLRGLGTDAAAVKIRIVPGVPKPDGVSDPQNRIVTIRVTP